jgi:hypothetical protein
MTMRIPWKFDRFGSPQSVLAVPRKKIPIHGAFVVVGPFPVNNPG